jgi:hypothetical protein
MEREPDLEIAASARADEVRFECKPEVRVRAYSNVPATADAVSERDNLPDEIEPGVTYRNVSVHWRAWLRLDDDPPPERGGL